MNQFSITEFGALGDGTTDCTGAIQAALDRAGAQPEGGLVLVPPGVYLTSELRVPAHVELQGAMGWSIRHPGGSVLKLRDSNARCLLNITKAYGCTVNGLTLEGGSLGKDVPGILFDREDFFDRAEEDTLRIERCQIRQFSGAGICLHLVCCFSIRNCQFLDNGGDGLFLNGWDGFILDNWFSGNHGWGIRCAADGVNNSSVSATGNRVEWNKKGGFLLQNAKQWQITGNYFDRSGGPALHIAEGITPTPDMDPRWIKIPCQTISVTGNIFNRSGANPGSSGTPDSSQIRMHDCQGVTVTGNTFQTGRDDNGGGVLSPQIGMVLDRLCCCVVANNTLFHGYLEKAILDMGGHTMDTVIENNPACPEQ